MLKDATLATDPRFDSNARRNGHRDALKALIRSALGTLTTEQVVARLDEAQIANARMNDMAGLWAHPQLKARHRWVNVGSPAGTIPALLPPGRSNAFDYRMDACARRGAAYRIHPARAGVWRCRGCRAAGRRGHLILPQGTHQSHS